VSDHTKEIDRLYKKLRYIADRTTLRNVKPEKVRQWLQEITAQLDKLELNVHAQNCPDPEAGGAN
jgi:hypothetical protein